jgi:hypothetical protein
MGKFEPSRSAMGQFWVEQVPWVRLGGARRGQLTV